MEEEKTVTWQQANAASKYIAGYFKLMGMKYPLDMPRTEEDIKKALKMWPKDVVAAYNTQKAYVEQQEGDIW